MAEKTAKIIPAQVKTPDVKPAAAVRKSATENPIAPKAAKPEKKKRKQEKPAGDKVIRASFTMPQSDYAKTAELKQRCLKAGVQVKKSELVRVGLHALSKLSVVQ